jgi:hypothetical protein
VLFYFLFLGNSIDARKSLKNKQEREEQEAAAAAEILRAKKKRFF